MMIKRLSVMFLIGLLMFTLTGCGKKSDTVFTLNGVEVDKKEVDIYGFIYTMEHSVVSAEQLNDVYEDGETYSEHYKDDLEKDIILSVLLNKEADNDKQLLSKEDKERAAERAEALIEKYGEDRLKELGIGKNDIEKVYEVKLRSNSYASSIGVEIDDSLVYGEDGDENSEESSGNSEENDKKAQGDDRYIRVFQITFPTVIYDESGMIKTDKDGQVLKVSSDEIESMRQSAQDFLSKVKDGSDENELLKDEPVNVTGVGRVLKYEDISDEYRNAVKDLKPGEFSEVINGEYGYYVVKLLDPDDDEHADAIKEYEVQKETASQRQKLYDKLFDSYVGNDKNYRNDELWDGVLIENYLK